MSELRALQNVCLDPVDRQNQVIAARIALVRQELAQLVTAGVALEEARRQDGDQEAACRQRLVQSLRPMLAKGDRVDVLEDLEAVVAGDDADLQLPERPAAP